MLRCACPGAMMPCRIFYSRTKDQASYRQVSGVVGVLGVNTLVKSLVGMFCANYIEFFLNSKL
ncbi:hypothetical protein M6B38_227235 [Iris pallida]|uniref:Uncharacterized protein n=1 Tax=Iris pallida TaxID=29817 RepID=A0AAX6DTI5_IRIPA|nr:hypothetical protein M6B38_227235 [Iris pallida]